MKIKIEINGPKDNCSLDDITFSINMEDIPIKNYDKIPDLSKRIELAFQDYFAIKNSIDKPEILKYLIMMEDQDRSEIF